MIKIGDKLLFDKYIPHNYMNGNRLLYPIEGGRRINKSTVDLERRPDKTIYHTRLIESKDKLTGIFIGDFRKKLDRAYRRPTEDIVIPRPTWAEQLLLRIRPSKSPARLDDPRDLDKMAMMRIGRKMIAVPMSNIIRCNFADQFKVI
jgi:hypothetical protein